MNEDQVNFLAKLYELAEYYCKEHGIKFNNLIITEKGNLLIEESYCFWGEWVADYRSITLEELNNWESKRNGKQSYCQQDAPKTG